MMSCKWPADEATVPSSPPAPAPPLVSSPACPWPRITPLHLHARASLLHHARGLTLVRALRFFVRQVAGRRQTSRHAMPPRDSAQAGLQRGVGPRLPRLLVLPGCGAAHGAALPAPCRGRRACTVGADAPGVHPSPQSHHPVARGRLVWTLSALEHAAHKNVRSCPTPAWTQS